MSASRRLSPLVLLLSLACQGQTVEPTMTGGETLSSSSSSSSSSSGATAMTTGAMVTTTATAAATTLDDGCDSHAAGGWNQCQTGNQTDNTACEWEEGSGAGMVLCLAPTSGEFNVCGIRDCVDVCDCFAPPSTGTAVPVCAAILGSGANGCALYCAGGQTCPDGMVCQTGYCYWPN